jgi:hypothetical protein
MWAHHAAAMPPVEPAIEVMMTPQRMTPLALMTEHASRLARQRSNRRTRGNRLVMSYLARNAMHRATRNGRHGAQQRPRRRIAVQLSCQLRDALR